MTYRAFAEIPNNPRPLQVFTRTRQELAIWIVNAYLKEPTIRSIKIYKTEETLIEEIRNPAFEGICLTCEHETKDHKMTCTSDKTLFGSCNRCGCRRLEL